MAMTTFDILLSKYKFLPFELLVAETNKLIKKVTQKHANDKFETTSSIKRKNQIKHIESILQTLPHTTQVPDYNQHYQISVDAFNEYEIKTGDLGFKISELKKIRELSDEQKILLNKLEIEYEKLTSEKNALFQFIIELAAKSYQPTNMQLNQELSDEYRSVILTCALLNIKDQIRKEYESLGSNLMGYLWKLQPENSELFSGIDTVIGMTGPNAFNTKDKLYVKAIYNEYLGRMEDIKNFDRLKLKKVQTVVKDPLYIYDITANLDNAPQYLRYKPDQMLEKHFKTEIAPAIKGYNPLSLNHVYTIENETASRLVADSGFNKLPNGKPALNKTIRDNEDPLDYMDGFTLPRDSKGEVTAFNKTEQQALYTNTMRFFDKQGLKTQLETVQKLKNQAPTAKQEDASVVKYQKR